LERGLVAFLTDDETLRRFDHPKSIANNRASGGVDESCKRIAS
jgi:hypothetical protein